MKYLKYIFMALTVAFVATSCDKRDPDFNAEQVSKDKAEVQVFLMTPVQNVSANCRGCAMVSPLRSPTRASV